MADACGYFVKNRFIASLKSKCELGVGCHYGGFSLKNHIKSSQKKTFSALIIKTANQHISMISEGSCDTEDLSKMLKDQLCIVNKLH